MAESQAEKEARRYLAAIRRRTKAATSDEEYQRALRKATASFSQLQRAVRLSETKDTSAS